MLFSVCPKKKKEVYQLSIVQTVYREVTMVVVWCLLLSLYCSMSSDEHIHIAGTSSVTCSIKAADRELISFLPH